jgi:hypothetical protein
MVQQTAVEWLENELENNHIVSYRSDDYVLFKKLFEQAKEMEKEQIIDAYNEAYFGDKYKWKGSEEYFNQTFNK